MSNGCWIAKLPQQRQRRTDPHRRRYRRSPLDLEKHQICKPWKTLTNKTLTHNKSLIFGEISPSGKIKLACSTPLVKSDGFPMTNSPYSEPFDPGLCKVWKL
jgi:hypothetical protein